MNMNLKNEKNHRKQKKHAARRREFHQHRLEQRPRSEKWPLPMLRFSIDLIPIDVVREEAVAGARL